MLAPWVIPDISAMRNWFKSLSSYRTQSELIIGKWGFPCWAVWASSPFVLWTSGWYCNPHFQSRGGGSWQMIQDEMRVSSQCPINASVTNLPLFLHWIESNLRLYWPLWTITHTLKPSCAENHNGIILCATIHSFIADRHIPRDGMQISSTVSRCHWFVRVRRLGHNWSLQEVPPVWSSVWLVETEYSGGFKVGCRWWANERPAAPVFGTECHKVNCSNVTQSQSMQHDSQLQSFSFGALLTSTLQGHRNTLNV